MKALSHEYKCKSVSVLFTGIQNCNEHRIGVKLKQERVIESSYRLDYDWIEKESFDFISGSSFPVVAAFSWLYLPRPLVSFFDGVSPCQPCDIRPFGHFLL